MRHTASHGGHAPLLSGSGTTAGILRVEKWTVRGCGEKGLHPGRIRL